MHVIIAGILLLISITAESQVNHHGPPCGGMGILDAGVHIKGHKVLDYNGIRYSEISADSLRNGFIVALSDTSQKVIWFLIDYESNNEIKEYPISGDKATKKNAGFITSIRPGDLLSLECINIQREDHTNLSTNFRIIVTY